ncbi:MAG: hypothetical protein Q8943_17390 [Bacteroidota bacterium]|nr:hypothetical protein [Bacteroidota bacterium]
MRQLPFMQIPICLPGPTDKHEDKEVIGEIYPEQIQAIYPGYHWGTMIYFVGGTCILTRASKEAVLHNIGLYWEHVEKKEKPPIFSIS